MEWMNHLQEYLREELADCMKYAEMAKNATGTDRQILHDMAKEEYQHAKHICHIMKEHGIQRDMNEDEVFAKAMHMLYE